MSSNRPSGRAPNQLRPVVITKNYTKHAEGSVLIEYGDTKVLCNASIAPGVPRFLKGHNQGWISAEYSMLPRSTHERSQRDPKSGRTMEIQRLISRALRATVNLNSFPEYTIMVDCDVIQADGGTRTASITGGCIALYDALNYMQQQNLIATSNKSWFNWIASVSVGIYKNQAILDLDYAEDSNASTDLNIVMNHHNKFIEIQGTAEQEAFNTEELTAMLDLAKSGINELFAKIPK